MIKQLKPILNFMQSQDQNGSWDEAIQDIENGDDSPRNILLTVEETLRRWSSETEDEDKNYKDIKNHLFNTIGLIIDVSRY